MIKVKEILSAKILFFILVGKKVSWDFLLTSATTFDQKDGDRTSKKVISETTY